LRGIAFFCSIIPKFKHKKSNIFILKKEKPKKKKKNYARKKARRGRLSRFFSKIFCIQKNFKKPVRA